MFLFETTRQVHKDRTVSLNGIIYEVDAALVGERVTLRYDPATPGAAVQVCHQGQAIERARRVDLYANCFVKRERPSRNLNPATAAPQPPPSRLKLRDLPPDEE